VDIMSEQIVLDNAPVFIPVLPDDLIVTQVVQGLLACGFTVPQVRGTFRPDHISGHAQHDPTVGVSAGAGSPSGQLGVIMLYRDLVAKITCRPGSGVRDQRFLGGQFQFEFVTQERRELIPDLGGFRFRSDDSQQVVIRVPG